MLAHGAVLRKNFFDAGQVIAIVKDFHNAGLTDEEVTLMAFAQKITSHDREVNSQDIEELRHYGLTDGEILDVTLACTARNFFSKTLDALNAAPDEKYLELEPELVKALSMGRPFALPVA
jgi:alkylhydroperoxidase family enzyme